MRGPPPLVQSQGQLEQMVRRVVAEEIAQFFEQTTIARSSEDDDERQDVVRLYEDPDSGGDPGTIDLARVELWGDIGIPPNKEPAIILRRGDHGVLFPVASNRYRPRGFKRGDRVLYSSAIGTMVVLRGDSDDATAGQVEVQTPSGAKVIIDKDGNVKIDAAANKDVVVNGGTAKVARDGDDVNMGKFDVTIGAGAITAITWTSPSGAVVPITPAGVQLTGKIAEGADHFKG
jgi:hypothetical protein